MAEALIILSAVLFVGIVSVHMHLRYISQQVADLWRGYRDVHVILSDIQRAARRNGV